MTHDEMEHAVNLTVARKMAYVAQIIDGNLDPVVGWAVRAGAWRALAYVLAGFDPPPDDYKHNDTTDYTLGRDMLARLVANAGKDQ